MSKLKEFVTETLIYGFANVFSRVFAMALIPLYNELGKDAYSNIVLLQSTFTVFSFLTALSSGVFYYYYEYERLKYRRIVFTSWFYYEISIVVILILVIFIFKSPIADFFIPINGGTEEIQCALVLLSFQFVPYIFNTTNINSFRIDRKPKLALLVTLLEATFTLLIVGTGIIFYNFGILHIVAAQLFARAIVAILFFNKTKQYLDVFYFSKKMMKRLVLFSWPFFVISLFSWIIISIDKFLGVEILSDNNEVALLSLAMQLSLPIAVLADMIRMAIGPFVMSIRKSNDAVESYQQIFDLSVFSGFGILILLIIFSPLLVNLLADESFLKTLRVLPLFALASVFSLIANQFAISFSLSKKNIYILWATMIAGILVFLINYLFMKEYGFIVAGISQMISYVIMAVFLYLVGARVTELKLKLSMMFAMLLVIAVYLVLLHSIMDDILEKKYLLMIVSGVVSGLALIVIYFKFQNLSPRFAFSYFIKRK